MSIYLSIYLSDYLSLYTSTGIRLHLWGDCIRSTGYYMSHITRFMGGNLARLALWGLHIKFSLVQQEINLSHKTLIDGRKSRSTDSLGTAHKILISSTGD